MLSGISQERNARSRGHWFTEFCSSQRFSHFAAHFIGVRAKISATGAAPVRGRRQRRQPLNKYIGKLADRILFGVQGPLLLGLGRSLCLACISLSEN